MTIMIVYITLRRRVSDVARKGFEKSTMDIRLQVWVRSAAIMSISFILLDEKRYDDREFYICETIPNEFWNLTSLWSIPISPVQLPGSSSTPYWESSLSTIEKSKPWVARLPIIWSLDEPPHPHLALSDVVEQVPDEALVGVATEGGEEGWGLHWTHPQVRSRLLHIVKKLLLSIHCQSVSA